MCLSQLGITQSTTRFAEWALLFCLQPLPQNLKNQNQYIVLKITCKYVNTKDIVQMFHKISYLLISSRHHSQYQMSRTPI